MLIDGRAGFKTSAYNARRPGRLETNPYPYNVRRPGRFQNRRLQREITVASCRDRRDPAVGAGRGESGRRDS